MSHPANGQVAADNQIYPNSQQQSSLRTTSPATDGSQCYSTAPIQPCPPQPSIQGSLWCHALSKQPAPETSDLVPLQQYHQEPVAYNRLCCSSSPLSQKQSNTLSKMNLHPQKRQRRAKNQSVKRSGDAIVTHEPLCASLLPSTTMQPLIYGTEFDLSGLGESHECEDAESPSRSVSSQKLSTHPTPLTAFSVPTPTGELQSLCKFPGLQPDDNHGACLYELLPKANDYWDFDLNDAIFAGAGAGPPIDNAFFRTNDAGTDYLEHGWFDFAGTNIAQGHNPYSSARDDQLRQTYGGDFVSELANPPTSTGVHLQTTWPAAPNQNISATIRTPTYNFIPDAGMYANFPNTIPNPPHSNLSCTHTQEPRNDIYDPHLPVLESVAEDHPGVFVLDDLLLNSPFTPTHQEGETDDVVVSEVVSRNRQNRRNAQMDRQLIEWKRQGLSYKIIKERGGFQEAESTLRGRYRTLTKSREDRLRKPMWPKQAIDALITAVEHFTKPSDRQGSRGRKHLADKIPWKKVAEWMVKERGCYRYGNATVKKKYQELLQNHRGLVR